MRLTLLALVISIMLPGCRVDCFETVSPLNECDGEHTDRSAYDDARDCLEVEGTARLCQERACSTCDWVYYSSCIPFPDLDGASICTRLCGEPADCNEGGNCVGGYCVPWE